MSGFKIRNFKGNQLIAETRRNAGAALFKAGQHVLNEANNIAPKDEGTLIQTSLVDVDEGAGRANVVYVQKYAARLHEHPEYNFQGGRQGKWLQKVIQNEGDGVRKLLAAELKKGLGG
jgi:hypothetical protein